MKASALTLVFALPAALAWLYFNPIILRPFGIRIPLNFRERRLATNKFNLVEWLLFIGVLDIGIAIWIFGVISEFVWRISGDVFYRPSLRWFKLDLITAVFTGLAFASFYWGATSRANRSAVQDSKKDLSSEL